MVKTRKLLVRVIVEKRENQALKKQQQGPSFSFIHFTRKRKSGGQHETAGCCCPFLIDYPKHDWEA